MTGVLSKSKPGIMSLACTIGLLAVMVGAASAQSFNSYDSNHVELLDGFTFHINGVAQSDLSNVGASGTYEFGFATGAPIHLKILSANSVWGAFGSIIDISSMSEFGIIAPSTSNLS